MENPVINGINTFADCFTLLECSMGKLFPKLFTSGHSGTVGEELVRWKWEENPHFLLSIDGLGMGHPAFRRKTSLYKSRVEEL